MWTIVCFEEENCVEAVPDFWYKDGCCAWPKKYIKNCKKFVDRRIFPNEVEFDYFKARPISQQISKCHFCLYLVTLCVIKFIYFTNFR